MAHLGLAASLYVHGKLYEALEHGRACLDMAARTHSADHFLHGHRILCEIIAEVHLLVGNVDEELATMREAHELAEETFYAAERLRVEADLRAAVNLAGAAACYARALETARHQGSIAFELRTTLSMCKNSLCGVQDLQPLLERVVGTSEDHDLREARMMLGLAF